MSRGETLRDEIADAQSKQLKPSADNSSCVLALYLSVCKLSSWPCSQHMGEVVRDL
jgi:hypothetical protein